MSDMMQAIKPKSDQLNADDLIGTSLTVTITSVDIKPGSEQPVSIHFEGDNGKPYKPCKSMSRVLVHVWGADAKKYVGKSLTMYRDPDVKWAGAKVGGIRISHMSHIESAVTMALTESKQNRKPFTVKPLTGTQAAVRQAAQVSESPAPANSTKALAEQIRSFIANAETTADLEAIWTVDYVTDLDAIKAASQTAYDFLQGEYTKRMTALEQAQ